MAKYSREQLKAMGMDENQITAILKVQDGEKTEVEVHKEPQSGDNIVMMNQQPVAQMKVTSFADLQSYAQGTIVRLPDFGEGQPFIAKLRRPSLLVLAKQGKIPNSLLGTANDLFANGGGGMNTKNKDMMADMYDVCRVVCESALVEPTLSDLEKAGIELSDNQLMAIFNYTQVGVKALESFR